MEFDNVWLEVRACEGRVRDEAIDVRTLNVPVLLEVFEAVANQNKHAGLWDYSRRLYKGEIEEVKGVLDLVKTAEDSRSFSLSTNVWYKGSCYTLSVFAIKRSE